MGGFNRITLTANLTGEPVIKETTTDGRPVCTMRVAATTRLRDADETLFIDVVTFGQQAESCAANLAVGSWVLIDGRLRFDEWEKDGERRNKYVVVARRVMFLDGKKKKGG